MKNFSNETPLSFLTVGEFKEILSTVARPAETVQVQQTSNPEEYVYGYQGIRNLLKVSHTKAWQLRFSILKPAIIMYGARKFMIHKETALKLISEAQKGAENES